MALIDLSRGFSVALRALLKTLFVLFFSYRHTLGIDGWQQLNWIAIEWTATSTKPQQLLELSNRIVTVCICKPATWQLPQCAPWPLSDSKCSEYKHCGVSYRGRNREVMVCFDRAKGAADSKAFSLKEFVTPRIRWWLGDLTICVKRKPFKTQRNNYYRSLQRF